MMTDSELVYEIAKQVQAHGGRTFYVGGCVRDSIMGLESKDIDIEVHMIEPDVLKDILSKFGKLRTQGASFGVYNLAGRDIDIAQPRTERCIGEKHTDFEVDVNPYIGVEGAAKRRDFTINALMQDVMTGSIVDPYNGLADLEMGIIRHVNDDTFKEDPLRVFRAAQFAARFGFDIAHETEDIMREMDLSNLSCERVYGEMKKALLKSDKPSEFFEVLRNVDQLSGWFDELIPMIGCEQSDKWHPEGDVWNHTMRTLDCAVKYRPEASNAEFYMVSALCHDMGKPVSWSRDENGHIHTYDHDINGLPIVDGFLDRLNNDKGLRKYVLNMTEHHMRTHNCFENNGVVSRTNKMFDDSICPQDLILLATADSESRGDDEISNYMAEREYLEDKLVAYNECMSKPEVTGSDLQMIGLKPGPEFSDILKMSHDRHLSGSNKDDVLRDIVTEYAKVNSAVAEYQKKKKEHDAQFVVSGSDLIALGLKPGPEFKGLLENLNSKFGDGKTKVEILQEFRNSQRLRDLPDIVEDSSDFSLEITS